MNDNRKLEGSGQLCDDPDSIVRAAWQEAHAMGANDGESSAFESILARLHGGACSAEEAIREARAIVGRKQGHH